MTFYQLISLYDFFLKVGTAVAPTLFLGVCAAIWTRDLRKVGLRQLSWGETLTFIVDAFPFFKRIS